MNDSVSYAVAQMVGNFAVIDYRDITRDDLLAVLEDLNTRQGQGFQVASLTSEFIWWARSQQKAQAHD